MWLTKCTSINDLDVSLRVSSVFLTFLTSILVLQKYFYPGISIFIDVKGHLKVTGIHVHVHYKSST